MNSNIKLTTSINQPNHADRYQSIQVLRGVAALMVLFCHLPPEVLDATPLPFVQLPGAFGVDIFFVISGFIMMYVTEKGVNGFLQKRAIRIIPLYWICTAVYGLIIGFESASQVVRSIFIFPAPLVGQAWTLIYEFLLYFVVFVATKINHRHRGIIASVILVGISIVGLFITGVTPDWFSYYFQPISLEFVWGIIAYYIIINLNDKSNTTKIPNTENPMRLKAFLSVVICVAALIIAYGVKMLVFRDVLFVEQASADGNTAWKLRFFYWGIFAFFIFTVFFLGLRNFKFPRFMLFIGDISFSVYLWHSLIINLFKRVSFINWRIPLQWLLGAAAIFVLSICISIVSYYLFEDNLLKWMRKKLKL